LIQKYEKSLGLGLGLEKYGGLGLGVNLDNKVLFTSLYIGSLRVLVCRWYHVEISSMLEQTSPVCRQHPQIRVFFLNSYHF